MLVINKRACSSPQSVQIGSGCPLLLKERQLVLVTICFGRIVHTRRCPTCLQKCNWSNRTELQFETGSILTRWVHCTKNISYVRYRTGQSLSYCFTYRCRQVAAWLSISLWLKLPLTIETEESLPDLHMQPLRAKSMRPL